MTANIKMENNHDSESSDAEQDPGENKLRKKIASLEGMLKTLQNSREQEREANHLKIISLQNEVKGESAFYKFDI